MAALQRFVMPTLALLVYAFVSSNSDTVDVALNKPIEASVTCGYLASEPFLSHRFVYQRSAVRENNTETCVDSTAYPPTAMVDGREDTWWQSASRRKTINVLGPDTEFEAEIFVDLQQVCNHFYT